MSKEMNILLDGKILEMQSKGGVTNYLKSIAKQMAYDQNVFVATTLRDIDVDSQHIHLVDYERFALKPGRLSYWLEKFYFEFYTSLNNVDVVHLPYYLNLFRDRINNIKKPVVLTVHDLIKEKFPHYFKLMPGEMDYRLQVMKRANAIICDSYNTKLDLLHFYPELESKQITVVHLATNLDQHLVSEPSNQVLLNKKMSQYFMFVGGRKKYKNFDLCLKAFSRIAKEFNFVGLNVVGSPFDSDELTLVKELELENRVHNLGLIEDSDLAHYYKQSIALIYPSEYEGFGLPPLEAISCGTCVIAASVSSIPEVVQDAGLFLSQLSINDLSNALRAILSSSDLRSKLIEAGEKVANQFSWENTCSKTLEVYQSVAC
jgi:glycosyltransferase involved in cell wall biosynthesis